MADIGYLHNISSNDSFDGRAVVLLPIELHLVLQYFL